MARNGKDSHDYSYSLPTFENLGTDANADNFGTLQNYLEEGLDFQKSSAYHCRGEKKIRTRRNCLGKLWD